MFTLITLATITQLGAPTNLRSKAGRTPLAQARHDDHEELVSSTLDLDMNLKDRISHIEKKTQTLFVKVTILSGAHKLQWTKQGREALVR